MPKEKSVRTPHPTPPSQPMARRKIVRGLFAAPALMTVCTGSAFAAQSSLRCLATHVTNNTSALPKVGGLDTWTRVQLHKATDSKYYVSGSQLAAVFVNSNSVYPAVGTWLGIKADGTVATGTYSTPQTTMPPGATLTYTSPQYVVVRFDNMGSVTGVGTAGTGANVGASCWTSFKAIV